MPFDFEDNTPHWSERDPIELLIDDTLDSWCHALATYSDSPEEAMAKLPDAARKFQEQLLSDEMKERLKDRWERNQQLSKIDVDTDWGTG